MWISDGTDRKELRENRKIEFSIYDVSLVLLAS